MNRRGFLKLVGLGSASLAMGALCSRTTAEHALANGQGFGNLRIFNGQYPRVFFFRQAEGRAAQKSLSYEQWEETFERLMGIEGKVLDEEVLGRSIRNIDFFTCFKQRHPNQLVLLHFNGNARDPRYESERFFAGHWIYFNGAKILSNVPAEYGETNIHVDKPNLFKLNMGRYRDRNEDIGLCMLDAFGKPNWHQSEQVQLISIDSRNKTIRVRRGCYGTEPRAFPTGQGYAAAHMTEGPWGNKNYLLWY
ncbi:MAG: twin-arginine translocation signal domain-containing protein, partial [Planctomycetota bacterium]